MAVSFIILDMENVEYSEWVPIGAMVKGLVVMVSSIVVFVTFSVFLLSENLLVEDIFGVAFAWVILGFILFVLWNFRGLRIQIKDDRLYLDYGLFNRSHSCSKKLSPAKEPKRLVDTWGLV